MAFVTPDTDCRPARSGGCKLCITPPADDSVDRSTFLIYTRLIHAFIWRLADDIGA
jgi:hypothetical protein